VTEGSIGGTSTDRRRDLVDVLRDLAELRDSGLLTEAEFQQARASTVPSGSGAETAEHPAR
jgi:putative oligomerization/nucleic acid binding protein